MKKTYESERERLISSLNKSPRRESQVTVVIGTIIVFILLAFAAWVWTVKPWL
jgi:hypothetical protein